MRVFPAALERLTEQFAKLPGIGGKSAQRLAFYVLGLPEAEAADKLLARLKKRLDLPDADEARLTERLQAAFEAEGYHALFGKTQGYYGPYVWRETVPAVYQVELPDGSAEYTVNLLKGFVFR